MHIAHLGQLPGRVLGHPAPGRGGRRTGPGNRGAAASGAARHGRAQRPRPGANTQYRQTEVDEWIKRFESAGREIYDQRDAILAASGVRPGLQVADVGAGTGLFAVLFGRSVAPGGKVYAIDIIPKFLAHLDRQLARKKIRNVVTRLGDERSIPLPANSVDLIFLCDAYHHFEYPRSMNASMWKALRPGGTLLLIDFKRVPGTIPAVDHRPRSRRPGRLRGRVAGRRLRARRDLAAVERELRHPLSQACGCSPLTLTIARTAGTGGPEQSGPEQRGDHRKAGRAGRSDSEVVQIQRGIWIWVWIICAWGLDLNQFFL